jgi:hypothetical protein
VKVPYPEPGNTPGWLLVHIPAYVGMVSGSVYAAQTAPSPLSAVFITVVIGLVGFGVGVGLFGWRATASVS